MKKKISFIIISLCALIISCAFLLGNYKKESNVKFITENNSYSYNYAKNNDIEIETVSDSNKNNYILNIVEFTYTTSSEGIIITKYNGINDSIVIPNMINNTKVYKIKANTFKDTLVKKVYIGSNITDYEETSNIELICYKNNYCDTLKENKDLNITTYNELNNINFDYVENNYEYNIHDKNIELTKYNGENKDLIIPSTINGYKVTTISFSLENYDSVYIPNEVNKILNNNFKYDNYIFMTLLINIVSFIVVLLVILLIIDNDNIIYQMPNYILSMIYLIIQFILSDKYKDIPKYLCIYSIILFVIYITIIILLKFSKIKIKDNDIKIKNNNYVNDVMDILDNLNIDNYYLKELIEDIKYSDPISNIKTFTLEQEIIDKIKKLDKSKDIENDIKEIREILRKRNNICKRTK